MIARVSADASLALAFRTEEGRAPCLGDPLDGSATALPHAGPLFTVVDLEDMLKIAEFPIGLPVVAQSRASGFDGFLEHGADRLGNGDRRSGGGAARIRQNAGGTRRRQAGAEKRLAHIYVVEGRDALLVEQRG